MGNNKNKKLKKVKSVNVVINEDTTLEQKVVEPALLYWRDFRNAFSAIEKDMESEKFPFSFYDELCASTSIFRSYLDRNSSILGSNAFWQAFSRSKQIFLCDTYFDLNCCNRLIVESANSVSSMDGPKYQEICLLTEDKEVIENRFEIQKRSENNIKIYCLAKFGAREDNHSGVHDRIALMDKEVWHCGATLAGMHQKLNAVSGPWPDHDGRILHFFYDLIRHIERQYNEK